MGVYPPPTWDFLVCGSLYPPAPHNQGVRTRPEPARQIRKAKSPQKVAPAEARVDKKAAALAKL